MDTYQNRPPTNNELVKWKINTLLDPRTNIKINTNDYTYKLLNKIYNLKKIYIDSVVIKEKSNKDKIIEMFQYLLDMNIFIEYDLFLSLDKNKLIKFNYEISDYYLHNFSNKQKNIISDNILFYKNNEELDNDNIEIIQKYLVDQILILLKCENETIKFTVIYIIITALNIVIPEIKEFYPEYILY
jgi:hypothetical protein